jgi:hypothetical protein
MCPRERVALARHHAARRGTSSGNTIALFADVIAGGMIHDGAGNSTGFTRLNI